MIAIAAMAFVAGGASASGATVARDLLSEANIQLKGAVAGDNAGVTLPGAGDVNGDGVSDLLIGAPNGRYSGRSGSGAPVSSAGDVNGDGLDDVLVSAPDAPYPPDARPFAVGDEDNRCCGQAGRLS